MKAVIVRAVMVSVLGIAVSLASQSGVFLMVSSALAYLLAAWAFSRDSQYAPASAGRANFFRPKGLCL